MDPWGIDDLTALLARMNGGYPSAALLVLALGAAFAGNGYGFLRLCGLGGTMRGFALWLVSLASGFAVCAFFCAAVLMSLGTGSLPCALCFLPVLTGAGCLLRFRRELFSPPDRHARIQASVLLVVLPLLLFAISAFQYPASWDECVYQLAVPKRWIEDGRVLFCRDLPYSGFPLLPQFLYVPLMKFCGFAPVKLMLYLGSACFFASLVLLASGGMRRNLTPACVFVASFLLAPLMAHVLISGYAEPQMAFLLAAGLLLAESTAKTPGNRLESPGFAVATGILAGAMASFKLTGFFAGASLLLYVLLRQRGSRIRTAVIFSLAGGLFALMFYQRPWIASGNPFYPYFGRLFGAPETMTSAYHHMLGTEKFAKPSVVTLILLLPGLAFPALSRMFDGVFGPQMLLWSGLALIALWTRPKRVCAAVLPLAFLAVCWFFSSPQARFLLPALAFAAILFRDAFTLLRKRSGRVFLWVTLAASIISFPLSVLASYGSNLRAMAKGPAGLRDIMYGRTGDAMLPCADTLAMHRASGNTGKCLMILEERTLYFPSGCEIGTPFFQDKYFPGGTIPDADGLLKLLDDGGFEWIYMNLPDRNPDYLPQAAQLWTGAMAKTLEDCTARGELESVLNRNGSVLFRRAKQAPKPSVIIRR